MRIIERHQVRLRSLFAQTRRRRTRQRDAISSRPAVEENIAAGMSPQEARYDRPRTVGGSALLQEHAAT